MIAPNAYPLSWPEGQPRTTDRGKGPFRQTMGVAIERLWRQLDLLGVSSRLISSNLMPRLDGRPYADQRRTEDPGVAVYFTLEGQHLVLACDRWSSVEQNIAAIGAHVEALRGQERWGVGTRAQAFAGYATTYLALAEGGDDWRTILGFQGVKNASTEEIRAQFRARVKKAHPDSGGSGPEMIRLKRALDAALAEIEGAR